MRLTPEGTTSPPPAPAPDQQKLDRVLGRFGNFAIALSTICVVAGGITSFHVGYCSVGGAAIGIGWPLGCLFALTVALTMAEVASAFPRAGGPYLWAAKLGDPGWGWVAGCFNLAGLVTALAAVNVGLCQFVLTGMSRVRGNNPASLPDAVLDTAVVLVTLSQALINHLGMRLTSWLTNAGGVLIVAVSLTLTGALIICPLLDGATPDLSRLVTFTNYSGEAGGNVWPASQSLAWLFALGLLLPAYSLTGFDASAQVAEETDKPEKNVPRGIVRAVLVSGAVGWVMLSAVVLAVPNPGAIAAKGDGSFVWALRAVLPSWLRTTLYVGIDAAQYVCGLATLTAASRLTWALARDNGLPFSRALSRVGSHHTPSVAIWSVCAVAALFAVCLPYTAVAAVCATFLYIAYIVPTMCGLLRPGRWPRVRAWQLGRWYRPLAAVAVLAGLFLIVISCD